MSTLTEGGFELCGMHVVMYPHCNMTKNLFGGQMMAWIDIAAAMYARGCMKTDRLVTIEVEKLTFRTPAPLGWTIKLYCATAYEGRSSLRVRLVATREHYELSDGKEEVAIETTITFVSVDENGRPTPWGPEDRPTRHGK